MSEEVHRKVTAFLSAAFAMREGRQCTKIQLMFGPAGAPGDELRCWVKKDYPEPEQSPFENLGMTEETVSDMIRIAEEYADTSGRPGNHRFEIRAHQALGGKTKCPFQIHVQPDDGGVMDGSFTQDANGVLGMTMRNTEFFVKQNMAMFGSSMQTMQHMIRELSEENARLRKERSDFFIELEQARSEEAERALMFATQTASDERKKEALDKLLQFAPIVASKLLAGGETGGAGGATGGPATSVSPIVLLINELAGSMNPEQLAKIMPALGPAQQAMFIETFQMARNAADAAAQAAAQAANKTSNGTTTAGAAGAGH